MASFSNQILAIIFIISTIPPFLIDSRQINISLTNDIVNQGLTTHCKSNTGKDLGTTTVGFGKFFIWKGDIVQGTRELYLCGFHTPAGLQGIFPLFISTRDDYRCGDECMWSARQDGVYLYVPELDDYELQFTWW